MNISIGPTGRTIRGDVLDCNKKHLEQALKDYDPLLYLQWAPDRNKRWGMWQLRRRSEKKTIKEILELDGKIIVNIDYIDHPKENLVKEFQYLDYSILGWVQRCDLWKQANYEEGKVHRVQQWVNDFERDEREKVADQNEKLRNEAVYNMLQYKTAIKQYKEAILSGTNPNDLFKYWK